MPELSPAAIDTLVFLSALLSPAAVVAAGTLIFAAIVDALISALRIISGGL